MTIFDVVASNMLVALESGGASAVTAADWASVISAMTAQISVATIVGVMAIVPERHKNGTWHFHGLISGIPSSEFVCPETITWRDPETNTLKRIRNTKGYLRWYRYSVKFGHFDCSIIKHYEACAAYVSKYITKQLADLAKSKHLYFCSQGLKKPDLVFDEDGVPFPFEQAEHEDEYCRISWASGEQLIGTMLPEWYDEWASDVREPEQLPAGMTRAQLEQYIFEPLTGEQLSLLESAEQVPVPWDM